MSDQEKKKSFLSILEEISMRTPSKKKQNGHAYPAFTDETFLEEESTLLSDELDHQILMHRDAHFGGDFHVMLDYYHGEGIGINPEFDLERISYLAEVERELGQPLAPLVLTGSEAEAVAEARRAYEQLKALFEIENPKNPFPRLLASLILTEEEEPEEEIEAIVSQGTRIVPELLSLLKSELAYDPLFPGYGYGPYHAILCLGKIKDPQAIIPIFETLNKDIVFDEIVAIEALSEIGKPAKEFLLKVLRSRPLTADNTHAAFALTAFANDPQVNSACFAQLQDQETQEKPLLRTYLLCNCEGLSQSSDRAAFCEMADDPALPEELRQEMQMIIKEWNR